MAAFLEGLLAVGKAVKTVAKVAVKTTKVAVKGVYKVGKALANGTVLCCKSAYRGSKRALNKYRQLKANSVRTNPSMGKQNHRENYRNRDYADPEEIVDDYEAPRRRLNSTNRNPKKIIERERTVTKEKEHIETEDMNIF